jgi:hypothetical protein
MDRATIELHLTQAERHVSEGERHIKRQRELVAELERDGHDISKAVSLLARFQEMQELHVADRDRLRNELCKPAPKDTNVSLT